MAKRIHTYGADDVEIQYDVKRCIHAARCVHGLPKVFDPNRKPWIDAAAGAADSIAEVIERCPSGALHHVRKDGGPEETPDTVNTVRPQPDGPLYLRGDVLLKTDAGETIVEDARLALCRCGLSANKPFCDNAHIDGEFTDPGNLGTGGDKITGGLETDQLSVTPSANGPLLLRGNFRIVGVDGVERSGDVVALCRCGHSSNKPFCDGTHRKVGFSG